MYKQLKIDNKQINCPFLNFKSTASEQRRSIYKNVIHTVTVLIRKV